MGVKETLASNAGSIIISIVLGLGLAALFRKACDDNKCVIIKGPDSADIHNYVYKINNECYKYETVFSECDA